ncbi:MAG: hypothetical protein ACLFU8_12855 [Anaerolineales bacterium]
MVEEVGGKLGRDLFDLGEVAQVGAGLGGEVGPGFGDAGATDVMDLYEVLFQWVHGVSSKRSTQVEFQIGVIGIIGRGRNLQVSEICKPATQTGCASRRPGV